MSVDDDLVFDQLDYRITASKDADEAYLDPAKFVERLTQAWINERAAPDVLPYEQGSVDGLLEKIEYQVCVRSCISCWSLHAVSAHCPLSSNPSTTPS